jgi:hypothetical protein
VKPSEDTSESEPSEETVRTDESEPNENTIEHSEVKPEWAWSETEEEMRPEWEHSEGFGSEWNLWRKTWSKETGRKVGT